MVNMFGAKKMLQDINSIIIFLFTFISVISSAGSSKLIIELDGYSHNFKYERTDSVRMRI